MKIIIFKGYNYVSLLSSPLTVNSLADAISYNNSSSIFSSIPLPVKYILLNYYLKKNIDFNSKMNSKFTITLWIKVYSYAGENFIIKKKRKISKKIICFININYKSNMG